MITVAKVSSTAYYTDGNGGGGMESYYLDAVTEGEPPGRWMGRGAALLGLSGQVTAEHMEALFEECVNPVTGEQLGRRPPGGPSLRAKTKEALAAEPDATAERQQQIRAEVSAAHRGANLGWDLTFAVPKSVSLAHAAAARGQITADREGNTELAQAYAFVKDQIEAAVLDAAGEGLAAAEEVVTARATGAAGGATTWQHGQGLSAAAFLQHTNRSIEPHLHVHMVVSNKIQCPDGKWRAIDGQDLLAQQRGFSATAARALVEGMNTRLALPWIDRHDGVGKELGAVPEQFRDVFSTRAIQTTAETEARFAAEEERLGRALTTQEKFWIHRDSGRDTRDRKSHDELTADELNEIWSARLANETGHSMNSLAATLLHQAGNSLPEHLRAAARDATRHLDDPGALTATGTRPGPADATRPRVPEVAGPVTAADAQWSREVVLSQAVAGCAQRSATWGRGDLKQEIERNLPVLGLAARDVNRLLEQLTDEALTSAGVVQVTRTDPRTRLAAPGQDEAGRGAGDASLAAGAPGAGLVFSAPSATVYAARDTLIAESALRAAAVERGRYALDRDAVTAWLDAHAASIGADQRAAVEGIASSDAALTVLIGPAGTGKSYAAGALSAAWSDLTAGEGRVIGLALSNAATQVLQQDGIGLARNISKWLSGQAAIEAGTGSQEDHQYALRAQDVVLVDETSMVSTEYLEQVRALVDAAGARLVLTGDPAQLGPIGAGGVMGLLEGHAETYSLSEVRRFTHSWERAASLALRAGDNSALEEYERHGRLVGVPTMDDAIGEAARRAVADRVAGRSTVVVAASNKQADTVSAKIRDHLIDLGIVTPGGGVLLAGRDGNTASTGDVVTCRRNDYALGVTNRVQYRVLATPTAPAADAPAADAPAPAPGEAGAPVQVPAGCLLVEQIGAPAGTGPVLLPAGYVAADLQLGYASTVHGAQGITTDTAYNLTGGNDRLDCAAQYVAQTRGRDLNVAIVALGRKADQGAPGPRTERGGQLRAEDTTTADSPRDVLASALAEAATREQHRWHTPGHEMAATVAAERDHAHATAMDTLTARIEAITRAACLERLDAHLDDAVAAGILDEHNRARLGADQAREHLSRLLRVMEQDGREPRDLLHHVLTHGKPLDSANSPAQVLAHRITRGEPRRGTPEHALTAPAPEPGTAIPAGINPHAARELLALHERAAARTAQLGRQTADQAPDWAVRALGPVPALDGTEQATADRADWEHRAGLVAAHRETTGDAHPTRALDRMPGLVATERRTGYAAAWHALGRPDDTLAEAAMSEGRLRIRVQAWEREKAWEPRYADKDLLQAETGLQEARHAAAIAAARATQADTAGDAEQAASWRAAAEQHQETAEAKALAVEGLTRESETYREWSGATVVTRDVAERARAEAERRGLDLTPAPTDAAGHDTPTDSAGEDDWRTITAADLTDEQVSDADRAWNAQTEHTPTASEQDPSSTAQDVGTAEQVPSANALDAGNGEQNPSSRQSAQLSTVPHPRDSALAVPAPVRTAAELELMSAGTAAVLAALADRASQEQAHDQARQEDIAIETREAGRRRREMADLDAAITGGTYASTYNSTGSDAGNDEGAGWDE